MRAFRPSPANCATGTIAFVSDIPPPRGYTGRSSPPSNAKAPDSHADQLAARQRKQRSPWRIGASLLAVVALLGLGGYWLFSSANDDAAPKATDTSATTGPTSLNSDSAATSTTQPGASIDETMAASFGGSSFSEFVSLLSDSVPDALGSGPYTVFAPTDDAFAKLPGSMLQTIQEKKGLLQAMLLHHVVAGAITPEAMAAGELTTLAGASLAVTKVRDQLFVAGNPVGASTQAANGYLYAMSDVLVPAFGTVLDVGITFKDKDSGRGNAGFGTLVAWLRAAGLQSALSGDGPFTVFAPVDAAFEALGPDGVDAALNDPSGLLTTVLTYHVVPGKVTTDQFVDSGTLRTVEGEDLKTTLDENGVWLINGNPILVQNIQADNGVLHVMGAVLIPPSLG